ncbi:MAG TPA: hypothetical protein DEP25_00925, partial [Candidatus Taylorbacteria bacterium]|nr:hypothetical protein [Candidatus Taylorbacteria bacterium]
SFGNSPMIKTLQRRTARKKTKRLGEVQQKILLLLLGGFALSCSRSPSKTLQIIRGMHATWKDIDKQSADRAIQALYESTLVDARENPDGTITLTLNEVGRKRALTYRCKDIKIPKPSTWDKKWRLIIFDVPEWEREARDSFRDHLDYMGFFCIQKSAWVYPYDCKNEIDFIIECLDIRKHIRFIIVDHFDNEEHLKKSFGLD